MALVAHCSKVKFLPPVSKYKLFFYVDLKCEVDKVEAPIGHIYTPDPLPTRAARVGKGDGS